jgi:hypothetical protein
MERRERTVEGDRVYEKLGSIKETVALSPRETLDSAAALLVQLGYEVTQRADTSVTAIRHKREGMFGHSLQNLTVAALPRAEGGVKVELRGNDREGVQERQGEWTKWADSLPKLGQEQGQEQAAPGAAGTQTAKTRAEEPVRESRESSGTRSGLADGERKDQVSEHAHKLETQPETASGGEDRRTPSAAPGRWATVASWDREQRVAPGKQETEPSSTQESPSSGDPKFRVDDDEGRDDAANDVSIPKVVEAESFRLVNERGELRAVLGLRGDSPYLEFKGTDQDYRFLHQVAPEDGLPKLTMLDNLGAEDVPKEAVQASATPETKVEPSAPVTGTPARSGYRVGDTAILSTGDTLTLHSYESPVPPPGHKKQITGYEFLVLDVDVCASSNSGGLKYINPFDFVLQMPDNTRLKPEEQHAERELEHIYLLPGDPVRGLVFFQKPKGEKPKFVIFTRGVSDNVHVVKWAV